MAKKKILFVCTGNTCRSPMAEALARRALAELFPGREDVEIASAGIAALPGGDASHQAINVMKETGIDLTGHKSAQIGPEEIEEATLVLTMTRSHRDNLKKLMPSAADKIYTLSEYAGAGNDIPDPYGSSEEFYRLVAGELDNLIRAMLHKFLGDAPEVS